MRQDETKEWTNLTLNRTSELLRQKESRVSLRSGTLQVGPLCYLRKTKHPHHLQFTIALLHNYVHVQRAAILSASGMSNTNRKRLFCHGRTPVTFEGTRERVKKETMHHFSMSFLLLGVQSFLFQPEHYLFDRILHKVDVSIPAVIIHVSSRVDT